MSEMLITAAEERKKGLTALYLDGEYAVSVDTVTLASFGYTAGATITDEQLHELLTVSNINRAKEKALYLIEYRSRTRRELWDKLRPLDGEAAAGAAIERLEELGLINDEAYARDYAEQLIERKHFSRERAAFEMMKKGIDRELADEVLDEYEKDPCEQIQALLETKFARRLATEKDRLRTVNALKAMGFRWSDIRTCLEELE